MCGIIGLLGYSSYSLLLDGLKQLQNRGYDSAGICTIINEKKYKMTKFASDKEKSALEKIEPFIEEHNLESSKSSKSSKSTIFNGIAHTRWATHGPKTDVNSHPHMCMNNNFCLVHNGIIENYKILKHKLIENGYIFHSQTDTEIIVNLLSFEYNNILQSFVDLQINNSIDYKENAVIQALKKTIEQLEGTWGLVILCIDTPNILYCIRHGSPLLISVNESFAMIVSEQSGFCGKVENYFVLTNNDLCILKSENNIIQMITSEIYELKKIKSINNILDCTDYNPSPYPHWTIKEINEQNDSCLRAISLGGRLISNDQVKLGGFDDNKNILININHLIILGCGTSYNAGMIGQHFFKELCDFNTVQVFDGAEFNENDIPKDNSNNNKTNKTTISLLLLSQSGETKDLHRCIEIGKKNNLFLIGVINVVDSMIAREVNCGCYLNAGREIAVASTKSFTSQVIILSMIAIWFAQSKNINYDKRKKIIIDLRQLHFDISNTINICNKINDTNNDNLLDIFSNKSSCFILGKGKSEAIAKEGALKIKEITYIHAEGYSTSSLKHGPFALLEPNFPVIMIATNNEHYSKCENAYEEIISRHANIIYITDKQDCDKNNTIIIPENKSFADLLCIIPLQIIAYKLAIKKGINPDMPQNLAKVVTVE